jgi:hypothetical protein
MYTPLFMKMLIEYSSQSRAEASVKAINAIAHLYMSDVQALSRKPYISSQCRNLQQIGGSIFAVRQHI